MCRVCTPRLASLLADIILSDPVLLGVFEPLFKRKDELGEKLGVDGQAARELGGTTVQALTNLLNERPDLRVGVVVDETQRITEVAEDMRAPTSAARA